ncbi:MAG: ABC transporter ATP-binding protein, partial [Candidatus Kariarchaeaceae archaeon]
MSRVFGNLETEYDRQYSDKELLKRYSRYVKEQKSHLLIVIIAIILGSAVTLIIPFTLQYAVDFLVQEQYADVLFVAILYLFLSMVAWIFDFIRNYENTKFTARSTLRIREDLYDDVQRHDMTFFDKHQTGSTMSRINDDVQVLGDFIRLTSDFLVNTLIALGTGIILFMLDIRLTLLAMTVIPFLMIVAIIFRKIARVLSRDWRISISKLNESFSENISGISVARSFGREKSARIEFDALNRQNYRINVKKSIFFSSIFPFVFAASNVGLFLVLYHGGVQSINSGNPTAGELFLYVVLLQRFYFPVVLISTYIQQVQAGMAAAERIFSLQDVVSDVKDNGRITAEGLNGEIEIIDLSFGYEKEFPVFDKLNLKIPAGQTVAIVGHTGAGKSSIVSLLARFYEYKEGKILVDGINIKDYSLKSYRSNLGLVLQEPLLFSGSIRDNIAYGNNLATEESIIRVAKAANAWDFVNTSPSGLDTALLERGKRLSHGQKQLISISRAFMVDPRILLLDEATASIDAYSEALIQEAIEKLLKDR